MTAVLAAADFQELRQLARTLRESRESRGCRCAAAGDLLNAALNAIEARRADGGDVADLEGTGDNVPEIHERARMKAADLWGLAAVVAVEKTGRVHETLYASRGRYQATVTVRCLNYAEISS
jgi:hypothetical protein